MMMMPNVLVHPLFGKVLFIFADIAIGFLLEKLIVSTTGEAKRKYYSRCDAQEPMTHLQHLAFPSLFHQRIHPRQCRCACRAACARNAVGTVSTAHWAGGTLVRLIRD